jgi:glycosyltransferase involved in cell wall biosynthesis
MLVARKSRRMNSQALPPLPLINPLTPARLFASTVAPAPDRSPAASAPGPRQSGRDPVSATVLTHNSRRHLRAVLAALAWCDEVVVLDSGSTDDTLALAAAFANTAIHRHAGPFPGFGVMHRHATELARHDWILSIDSDEVLSAELAAELRALPLDAGTVYALPFQNYFNGRLITTCGWQGECHARLFHRRATGFSDRAVHEQIATAGLRVQRLRHPVRHYSYASLDDFLRKQQAYSTLFAEQHRGRKASGPGRAWAHGVWAFFRCYILKRGFRQGYEGFVIRAYNAHTAVWKYLKLHEANRRTAT